MKSRIIAILIISTFFIVGCDRASDVTDKRNYWGAYKQNEKLITKEPLFLIKVESKEAEYALVPEGQYSGKVRRHYNRPSSVDEFKNGKLVISNEIAYQLPIEVITVVENGTILEPQKVVKFNKFTWFFGEAEFIRIFGRLNGNKYNNLLIDFEDISVRSFGGKESCCRNHSPNSDLLKIFSPNKTLKSGTPQSGAP